MESLQVVLLKHWLLIVSQKAFSTDVFIMMKFMTGMTLWKKQRKNGKMFQYSIEEDKLTEKLKEDYKLIFNEQQLEFRKNE